MFCLSVGRVEFNVFGNFDFPPVAVLQKFLLVINQFLAGLGRKFEIGPSTIASTGHAS